MRLKKLGGYLRKSRLKFKDKLTQEIAATKISEIGDMGPNGKKVTQSLLSQYESGQIGDPDPQILRQIAAAYEIQYEELVVRLVREKYDCFLLTPKESREY